MKSSIHLISMRVADGLGMMGSRSSAFYDAAAPLPARQAESQTVTAGAAGACLGIAMVLE
ncbi:MULTISPECIES: hypothetical protein [unclassified Burkholderia]|uniref:hypothetical protein n=1 Tax=unclassified Burkholderia TaxID=2613784 RepID=UPI001421B09D|nr:MULTISPECIES: hypothetical protein [unclassified Burkholderia]NIE87582.1 hypothetical protein [Burkholderia sp. Tr-860]NIF66184.1 hypothetical protein [Burkholderia sp. Cy-647]NIF97098.1 hypothetical protein [Burkholderia sp. Ax-1720]